MKAAIVALAAAAVLAAPAGATASAPNAGARMPWLWRSCAHVNTKYAHGVGRRFAVDKTTGTKVTNFRRSTLLYRRAMSYNKGLDRDKDGIACEKL